MVSHVIHPGLLRSRTSAGNDPRALQLAQATKWSSACEKAALQRRDLVVDFGSVVEMVLVPKAHPEVAAVDDRASWIVTTTTRFSRSS